MTGDQDDILRRVKSVIPNRWFSFVAPIRDSVLGGLSDLSAWCYDWTTYARLQSRISTSTGPFLDLIAYDFLGRHLLRRGRSDDTFRSRILAIILQERVTRSGMVNALISLTGKAPVIIEPWNTGDTGAWDVGTFAFDTAGCWGDLSMDAQCLITAYRPTPEGIANVSGFDDGGGGYDVGAIEWVEQSQIAGAVTDQDILDTINTTRPTGTICWVAIVDGAVVTSTTSGSAPGIGSASGVNPLRQSAGTSAFGSGAGAGISPSTTAATGTATGTGSASGISPSIGFSTVFYFTQY